MKTKIINKKPAGNYTDDYIATIDTTGWEFAPLYEGNFLKPEWNGTEWKETATAEEIEFFTTEKIKTEIKQKYEVHKAKGIEFYENFRALIVLDIYKGLITEIQAFFVEELLKVAFDRINNTGDWKTALFELNQVTPKNVTEQKYCGIAIAQIQEYIQNNYEN